MKLTAMPISFLGMVHNSSEYLHTVIEALSLSFADTLWYNADPSKVKVPVSELLHKDYAAKRRALIKPDRFGGRFFFLPFNKLCMESQSLPCKYNFSTESRTLASSHFGM